MLLVEGLKDFAKDLINPKLLVFKFVYFNLLAAAVILWPQFTIHQKSLGLTEYHTGIFSSVNSVFVIFIPFLSGVMGDKLGNFRVFMVTTSAVAAVSSVLFVWVPSAMVIAPLSNNGTDEIATNASTAYSNFDVNVTSLSVDPQRLTVTFWIYLAVRTSYGVTHGICYTLYEAAVMANIQNSGINFGYQRAWGTVGVIVSSYVGGVLVELTNGFNMLFYVSCALQILVSILMFGVKIDFKVATPLLTRGIIKNLVNVEALLFLGSALAAGMFLGYFETFMYRFLFGLGATPVLIGLTVTVGAPFELIVTLLGKYLISIMGHASIIMLGLLAFAVRFLGFSFLTNPWWVLPLEIVESLGNGMMQVVSIMYLTVLFPMESIASFRGVYATVYFGIGKLLGTLIGTEIRERLGHVSTFQIWSGIALACTVAYFIAYNLLRRKKSGNFSTDNIKGSKECSSGPEKNKEKRKNILGIDNRACVYNE